MNLSNFALVGGALGIGIGFGMQNVVGNFVSGVILLIERSLKVGDFVELASGVRSTVTEIAVRYTRVTTNSDVDSVIVPNSEFTNARVTNWTLDNRYRRINVAFNVAYGTDKNLVRDAALEAASSVPLTITDESRHTDVWFTKFGDNALEFQLVVWIGPDAVNRRARLSPPICGHWMMRYERATSSCPFHSAISASARSPDRPERTVHSRMIQQDAIGRMAHSS